MTRIIWKFIKEKLILPYVDVDIKYFDLGIESRDKLMIKLLLMRQTQLKNMVLALNVQPSPQTEARVEEFKLKQMWRSQTAPFTIFLDGTVFAGQLFVKMFRALFLIGQVNYC